MGFLVSAKWCYNWKTKCFSNNIIKKPIKIIAPDSGDYFISFNLNLYYKRLSKKFVNLFFFGSDGLRFCLLTYRLHFIFFRQNFFLNYQDSGI